MPLPLIRSIQGLLAVGLLALLSFQPRRSEPEPTLPHVVIIMADQLRYDVLDSALTPNIHRLRAEGVHFRRAYCASPICVPSRGSFFTGRYPNQTGSLINPWEPKDKTYGTVRAGIPNLYGLLEGRWDSWHTGKQHFYTAERIDEAPDAQTHWLSFEKGYQPFLKAAGKPAPGGGGAYRAPVPEMASGRITRPRAYSIPTTGVYQPGLDYFFDGYILKTSLDALRQRDRSKPLLLNAMFLAPHPPLQIPEPYFSKVKSVQLPDNVGRWSKQQSPLQLYNLTGFLGGRYAREDWGRIWPVYLGLVSLLDDAVGQLVAELKRQGIYDQTLIVFTADHGEMLGSHRLWQKMCMYEESAKVPLIVKFPKSYQPRIRETDAIVSHVDVLPTLLDYLKLPLPAGVAGRSLLPVIVGHPIERQRIFIQFDGNGALGNFQRCVVEGDYKLIVDIFKDELFLELYNVKTDPQEGENLAFRPEQKSRVLALLGQLQRHMQTTGDRLSIPPDVYESFLSDYGEYAKRAND